MSVYIGSCWLIKIMSLYFLKIQLSIENMTYILLFIIWLGGTLYFHIVSSYNKEKQKMFKMFTAFLLDIYKTFTRQQHAHPNVMNLNNHIYTIWTKYNTFIKNS